MSTIFGEGIRFPQLLQALRTEAVRRFPGLNLDAPGDVFAGLLEGAAWIGHLYMAGLDATGLEIHPATCRTPEALAAHARRLGVRPRATVSAAGHIAGLLRPGYEGVAIPLNARFAAQGESELIEFAATRAVEVSDPTTPILRRRSGAVWVDGIGPLPADLDSALYFGHPEVVPGGVAVDLDTPGWFGVGASLHWEYATDTAPAVSPTQATVVPGGIRLDADGIATGVEVRVTALASGLDRIGTVVDGAVTVDDALRRAGGDTPDGYSVRPLWAPLQVTDGTRSSAHSETVAVADGDGWRVAQSDVSLDLGVTVTAVVGGITVRGGWITGRGASGIVETLQLGGDGVYVELSVNPDVPPTFGLHRHASPLRVSGAVTWGLPVGAVAADRVRLGDVAPGGGEKVARWFRIRPATVGPADGLALDSAVPASLILTSDLAVRAPITQGRTVEVNLGPHPGSDWWETASGEAPSAEGEISLTVAGVDWSVTLSPEDFAAAGADDQVALATHEVDGSLSLRFGGGGVGAVPAEGDEVVLTHRAGAGEDGNLSPGQVALSLDGLGGLRRVWNPAATRGWSAAEIGTEGEGDPIFDVFRATLPSLARSAVGVGTRSDVERLVTTYRSAAQAQVAARARALPRHFGPETVGLAVHGADGAAPSVDAMAELETYLNGSTPGDGVLRLGLRGAVFAGEIETVDLHLTLRPHPGQTLDLPTVRDRITQALHPVARDATGGWRWRYGDSVSPGRISAILYEDADFRSRVEELRVVAPAAPVLLSTVALPVLGNLTLDEEPAR